MGQTHNTFQIRVRVPRSLKERIDALADKERRQIGNMITELLERGMIEHKLIESREQKVRA